jgi:16S rRNA (guanine966-N2)-methyltransferase
LANARANGSNAVRVIAGTWRSRKITFPATLELRPTPDRIRETLFNWLQQRIVGAACLDLFAGSGILGIEAASRGASVVVAVEQNPAAAAAIQANVAVLTGQSGGGGDGKRTIDNSSTATEFVVVNQDALLWLNQRLSAAGVATIGFDIIFLDPPYQSTLLLQAMRAISQAKLLRPTGVMYFETNNPAIISELENQIPDLQLLKSKKAGQVYYCLGQFKAD